jgi:hypothetical protein
MLFPVFFKTIVNANCFGPPKIISIFMLPPSPTFSKFHIFTSSRFIKMIFQKNDKALRYRMIFQKNDPSQIIKKAFLCITLNKRFCVQQPCRGSLRQSLGCRCRSPSMLLEGSWGNQLFAVHRRRTIFEWEVHHLQAQTPISVQVCGGKNRMGRHL